MGMSEDQFNLFAISVLFCCIFSGLYITINFIAKILKSISIDRDYEEAMQDQFNRDWAKPIMRDYKK